MTSIEAMRYAMKEKHMTQQKVADIAGYQRQVNVSQVLMGKHARTDNLVKILNACGYDLVMVDRSDRSKQVVIDLGEDEPLAKTVIEEKKTETVPENVTEEDPVQKPGKRSSEMTEMFDAFAEWYEQRWKPTRVSE